MNKITLENFRCFREKQEARLAPLTLLVGENSTGKTSFLALIRALWDVTFGEVVPDFKVAPYDLGTFDEIAHYRGGKGGRADSFVASLVTQATSGLIQDEVTFKKKGTAPFPVKRTVKQNDAWLEHCVADNTLRFCFGASLGEWVWDIPFVEHPHAVNPRGRPLELSYLLWQVARGVSGETMGNLRNRKFPSKRLNEEDKERLDKFCRLLQVSSIMPRPFASAPVRSKPRRTYDPARPTPDPEGVNIPMYLAEMHFQGGQEWSNLKNTLEEFGKRSGLFGKITVKRYGKNQSEPFQLQVKKTGGKLQGPWRNLIDVGYGVSQVLPIITELFHPDLNAGTFPRAFLMQQPEVHLHPSAQAALGSLFCELAGAKRQLVVETHSDYLLDRVRMDVRDGKSKLKPEDVSILYFERKDLEVEIHSLQLDERGRVMDAPPSYRKFFMDEVNKRMEL